ncbi:hypothetical protein A8B75_19830 [Sphingomonadales bacterium EhC05]|nr:hypothetical protein A8B75_19830 [Sphingomonadales bacterium EhC05]
MRFSNLIWTLMIFAAIGSGKANAKENCQRFQQDDGSTKVLCQDKKGRWIEQKRGSKVKYDPLKKARVVYEGTRTVQDFMDTANRRRGEISLGTIFGTALMNPVGSPTVTRVRITIVYDGSKIVVREHLLDSRKTFSYNGSRTKKKCNYVKTYGKLSFKFNSKCGQLPFNASASSPSVNGRVTRIKYETQQVNYVDLYQQERERERLTADCNDKTKSVSETIAACTELEEL